MITKIRLLLIGGAALAIVTLFFLWRNTVTSLESTEKCLTEAQQTIEALKLDNDNLLKYNIQRDKELSKIKVKYEQALKEHPADACGDQKPSPELLEYLRKAL